MKKLIGRRQRKQGLAALAGEASAERATVGLAVLAIGAFGTLLTGELLRLARRRRDSQEAATPANLVDAAGYATRDTLAVARRGIQATPHHEALLFNILEGFLGGFTIARFSTWGIRHGWWPAGNVHVSGRHIHHFASGIGAITTRNERVESTLAIPFGVGMGMTMDEAALLLDLRDVYWTREGLLSVQVSLGVTATLAATILALRMLRRGEERGVQEGVIPNTDEHEMRSTGALA
jgi:hypothetical protein